MLYRPSRRYENKLKKKGYALIAGIDEAGKGAWAGPVVAGCVVLPINARLRGLRDSKFLPPHKRESLYSAITNHAIAWSVGVASHEVIDTIGIIKANQRAMEQALSRLTRSPDYILIDGLPFWRPETKHEFIIKGDRFVTTIAAASIIAKVTRDQILRQYDSEFPEYGFAAHKGYGTREHKKNLDNLGPSPIHRRSYRPIIEISISNYRNK